MHVFGKLNDFNITELLKNVVYLNESNINLKIGQGQIVSRGHSFVKSINGIVLDDYLARVRT